MQQMAEKNKNLILRIACILLVMVMLTTQLLCRIYASFATEDSSGDGARVAAFSITQEGTIFRTIEADVIPGTIQVAELTITNKSEVAMEYTLTVTNETRNLEPLKFKLNSADGTATPVSTESYENGISKCGVSQIPGEHTDKYILNIVWEPSANEDDDLALIGMVDYITVSVTATQMD